MLAVDPEGTTDFNPESEIDETFDNNLSFESIVDPASWKPPGEYYQTMPAAARNAGSLLEPYSPSFPLFLRTRSQ